MQYLYHPNSKDKIVKLRDESHKYIFKVRRHKLEDIIYLRNLKDNLLYSYKIENITKNETILSLEKFEEKEIKANRYLHIGWCIIEPKNIEKMLPTLNEMGVSKISFIYCKRTQKQWKIDLKRLEKILLNSSQQSGRTDLMEFDIFNSLIEFKKVYKESYLLNFSSNSIKENIKTIVIGCEGGFTKEELELFNTSIVGLQTPLILKSESAVVSVASKILL